MTENCPRAVLFDLDGTLYDQSGLRRRMLLRVAAELTLHPFSALQTVRVLKTYRGMQETMRGCAPRPNIDLATDQIRRTAVMIGCPEQIVDRIVARWMDEEPLHFLRRFVRPGLEELLRYCRKRSILTGVFTDYPAHRKLQALGVAEQFDAVVCAQDADVQVFKPHPKGLLQLMARLNMKPADCWYVGDRADVDAAAARAAGVRPILIQPRGAISIDCIERFGQLQGLLEART